MPAAVDPEGSGGDTPPKASAWNRVRMPRSNNSDQSKPRLMDRLNAAVLKPEDPDKPSPSRGAYELSGEELEVEAKQINDKERAIGLLAGPVATVITFFIVHLKVASDPPARLANGAIDRLHVNPSTYEPLFWTLIILSFGITAMAMWRKRLPLGIVTSMYGLSIFNSGYFGFGVPFVMVGAWYLVRAYRLHRNLKESTVRGSAGKSGLTSPNKRYTPPSSAR
jgi:hypothetical protein